MFYEVRIKKGRARDISSRNRITKPMKSDAKATPNIKLNGNISKLYKQTQITLNAN